MVKKLEPKSNEQVAANIKSVYEVAQEPIFEKKPDKSLDNINQPEATDEEREIVSKICPHYYDLKDRYAEYKNFDDDGKNPLPLRIDRVHELSAFEATIAQADLTKDIDVFPTRLIKTFSFETGERKTFLIVDKRVVGIDKQGRSTNISSVRIGRFKYPSQFEQDRDGDWRPISNQFKTILNIPFSVEEASKYAHVGNPFIKKYVVWHPDGIRRGHFTLQEFTDLTDDEQIKLIEDGKR
jgi:hypothetical protein